MSLDLRSSPRCSPESTSRATAIDAGQLSESPPPLPVHFSLQGRTHAGHEHFIGRVTQLTPLSCTLATPVPLLVGETLTVRFYETSDPFRQPRVLSPQRLAVAAQVLSVATSEHPIAVGPVAAVAANPADTAPPLEIQSLHQLDDWNRVELCFAQPLKLSGSSRVDRLLPALTVSLFVGAILMILLIKSWNIWFYWQAPLFHSYSLLVAGFVLSRFLFAGWYRPPDESGQTPSLSLIIAAKDEQGSIGKTLDFLYLCDYPREKLEVIAVDDGSTDGTLLEMQAAAERHQDLQIISFERNRGKRQAMAAGIRRATGEILVFVDSDTFLNEDALRKLVRGFADPQVGAICGHAFVENVYDSHLTRMQEVRYYVSFRVLKAAESLLGVVACCSGCLSAYRRQFVLDVLDPWLKQRFLGTEATFGDDRSLTNHLLKKSKIIYDSQAVCTTIVPVTLKKFFRQQLRWKKSWIRESLVLFSFLWKRHPLGAFFYSLQILISLISPLCVTLLLLLPLVGFGHFSPIYAMGILLVAILYGLVYLMRFRDGLWIQGVLFQFLYSILLAWQNYYAFLTVRRNHWGTR